MTFQGGDFDCQGLACLGVLSLEDCAKGSTAEWPFNSVVVQCGLLFRCIFCFDSGDELLERFAEHFYQVVQRRMLNKKVISQGRSGATRWPFELERADWL